MKAQLPLEILRKVLRTRVTKKRSRMADEAEGHVSVTLLASLLFIRLRSCWCRSTAGSVRHILTARGFSLSLRPKSRSVFSDICLFFGPHFHVIQATTTSAANMLPSKKLTGSSYEIQLASFLRENGWNRQDILNFAFPPFPGPPRGYS